MLKREMSLTVTRENVIKCAKEMGIPEEAMTDDVVNQVQKFVELPSEYLSLVVKQAINLALKN